MNNNKSNKQTFTLTFGNCAENHRSMQIIGTELDSGLGFQDLQQAEQYFTSKGYECQMVHLKSLLVDSLSQETLNTVDDAYLLIVKKGVDCLLAPNSTNDLYLEQEVLQKDTKAFMYGRVVNKKARHNLCFSDFSQQPDYENKKGTVYNFGDLPLLKKLREKISQVIKSSKVTNLQCEGNYYYDVETTYIGWHSDLERNIVIAARLGADFPIYFRWYLNNNHVGNVFECVLSHGDMYFMSDKTVGTDGRKRSIYTLRHAAGPRSCVGLETIKKAIKK